MLKMRLHQTKIEHHVRAVRCVRGTGCEYSCHGGRGIRPTKRVVISAFSPGAHLEKRKQRLLKQQASARLA
jgi:hypothetical protein